MHSSAILLISCPDRKGIVATVADFVYRHNGNILCADEHGDEESSLFFLRVEFDPADFDFDLAQFSERFAPIARDRALASSSPMCIGSAANAAREILKKR